MERVIKFRAWLIEEKKMLESGDWFFIDPTSPCPVIQYADQGYYCNNANASEENKKYLLENKITPEDDFALMQYTGLNDKDGKEIYEGDIVMWEDRSLNPEHWRYAKVEYYAPKAQYCFTIVKCGELEVGYMFAGERSFGAYNELKVLGNIYQNPELLK